MDSNNMEKLKSVFLGFFLCTIFVLVTSLLLILIIERINLEHEKEITEVRQECLKKQISSMDENI